MRVVQNFWSKYKGTIFRLLEVFCYIIVILAGYICVRIFLWEREIHFKDENYVADADILGNFGDFMAGTLGCVIAVVSMYLLFRTLKSQRAATLSNNQLMTVQRFNDLFFRLIDLYHQLSNDLVILENESLTVDSITSIKNIKERRNKDFFDLWKSVMESGKQSQAAIKIVNLQSLDYYQKFYNRNKNKLGAYFRTLYRTIELIDQSEISNSEKRNYSKILRAQLCESELFMLYYNSQTTHGLKLGKYLWKYHILKHLPICETIEFKKLYPSFNDVEKNETERIYSLLLKATKNIVSIYIGKTIHHTVEHKHFVFDFTCSPDKRNHKNCQVNLTVNAKDRSISDSEPNFMKFSSNEWSAYFKNMLFVINLFQEHTSFSCQSEFINKKPKRIFIYSLISYRNSNK